MINLTLFANNVLISVSFDSAIEQGYYLIVEKIRVLVADDHPIVRDALWHLCEIAAGTERHPQVKKCLGFDLLAKVEKGESSGH